MRPKVRRLAVIVGATAALGGGWSATASAQQSSSAQASDPARAMPSSGAPSASPTGRPA